MKKYLTPGNILFYALLIAMLVPTSRKFIQVNLLRVLSFAPNMEESSDQVYDDSELQMYLINESGERTDLSSLSNKALFVNIWATWCPPCIAEMPSIDELYERTSDDIAFIVASGEPIDKISAFKKKNGYSFPVYQIAGPLPEIMTRTNSIPSTYIFSKDRKLIVNHTGGKNWAKESFIKELLAHI